MIDGRKKSIRVRLAYAIGLLSVLMCAARAEQLPVKIYNLADGLAHDEVNRIVQDSQGFLWFCTTDGLSRFDGYSFTTYGVKDGLPSAIIYDLLETRRGIYWIATKNGVSRFDPTAKSKTATAHSASDAHAAANGNARLFTIYSLGENMQANIALDLYEDRAGHVWVGTQGGLFRLAEGNPSATFERVKLNIGASSDEVLIAAALLEDRTGSLWIGTLYGAVRRLPDGRAIHYTLQSASSTDYVRALLEDREGRLWLGHQDGLHVFQPESPGEVAAGKTVVWRGPQAGRNTPAAATEKDETKLSQLATGGEGLWFTTADGLAHNAVSALTQTADGRLWIATRSGGLSVFDGRRFRAYATAQGISNRLHTLTEDRDGNLWVGTQTGGALKISRSGFISYGETDGLTNADVVNIFERRTGELCVIGGKWTISCFDGERFNSVRPNLPPSVTNTSSVRWWIIEDHAGEWWVATGAGLYRFPQVKQLADLAHAPPLAVYTTRDGLADNNISRLIEDGRGDIWIGSYNPPVMLTRWERQTGVFQRYAEAEGLPAFNWANVFKEDAAGNLWIGLHNGGMARHHAGRFEVLGTSEGVPGGLSQGIYLDGAGRLWIATSQGAARMDEPTVARPRALPLPMMELASHNVFTFVEDVWGNIYIGGARGVDRLEPATGRIKHFTTADGLVKSEVVTSFRAASGALWFGTREGVSRLLPEKERPQPPPSVLIGGLRIAGAAQPISELGETMVTGLVLDADQNQIQIDFFGLSFSAGAGLRYQYKLEGSNQDWSAPSEQRSITFANLAPGAYSFLVRAVNTDGATSDKPAIVSFTLLPPIWQRWWFLALLALTVSAGVYAIFRYRVAQAVELERVRTRIATDLHDDIGASLSQIAILSEVAHQRAGANGSNVGEPLELIAGTSREIVDAMSDIVWAINPQRDHLRDLFQRMRRFASDILDARDINFRFRAPGAEEKNIRLGADLRREIYLIFKESVNNLAKHSGATEAELLLQIEHDWLKVVIRDNGAGFDVEQALKGEQGGMGGHGLQSLRRRAESLGGSYEIVSEKGKGTTVTLKIPLRRRPAFSLKKLLPKQVVKRRR